jgi:enamine deaminase RidA (YjgF/YER057c/UK114 family)
LSIRRALEPDDYPFFDYRRFSFSLGIAAAGRIWLSGSTAVRFEPPAGMAVKGDLIAQASVIHAKMAATLAAARRGLRDVVRVVRYLTPKALPDLPALEAYQRQSLSEGVSVSTIPVRSLLREEALIEIEAIAGNGGADGLDYFPAIVAPDRSAAWDKAEKELAARGLNRSHIKKVTELATPAAFETAAPAGRSPGLRVCAPRLVGSETGVQLEITVSRGGSSVVCVSMEADPAKEGVVAQCRDLYRRLGAKLTEAGASFGSVVKTTEYIVPAALMYYRGTADVRRDVFAVPYPAATGVVCERLGHPGAMIAVEATALTGGG